jgi:hypothetical protein
MAASNDGQLLTILACSAKNRNQIARIFGCA